MIPNKQERQILLSCFTCGLVELDWEQYIHQLNLPNALWYCPKCGKQALWYGIFVSCVYEGCDGRINTEVGKDECPECGNSQEDWWNSYYNNEEAET